MAGLLNRSVLTVVLLAAILAVMMLAVYAQWGMIRDARADIELERAALARVEAEVRAKQELQARLPALEARLAAGFRSLPVQPDESALLAELERIGNQAGVRSLQVRFGPRVAGQGYTEMPLTIAFEGRYHGLLFFLDRLGAGERAVRVDAVNVSKGGTDPSEVNVEIRAGVFYRN